MDGKKIQLLVCFIHAHIGGAMTSLVNFLNSLDTEKYDVDVLFYENGPQRYGIKPEITILPQGKMHRTGSASNVFKKLVDFAYIYAKIQELYYKKVKNNKRLAIQIVSKQGCKLFPRKYGYHMQGRLASRYRQAVYKERCIDKVVRSVRNGKGTHEKPYAARL